MPWCFWFFLFSSYTSCSPNTHLSLFRSINHTHPPSQNTHQTIKPSAFLILASTHPLIAMTASPASPAPGRSRGLIKRSIAAIDLIRTMTKQNHARASKHSPLSISLPRLAAGVLPMTLGLSGAGEPQVRKDAAVSGRASRGPSGRPSCANRRRMRRETTSSPVFFPAIPYECSSIRV